MMVNNTTSMDSGNEQTVTYNSTGAIIFIVVVLLWYSSSILFLMLMQIGRSNERIDGRGRLFVRNFRKRSNNTEVLKELVDKQKRDKLWDIYLGTSGDMHDKITRDEVLRIRHIEKRLASLNEDHRRSLDENSLLRPHFNLWSSAEDVSSSASRRRTRRRSSVDQKILGEWSIVANELKTHENWPWAIQRLLIRRQLRRQKQTTECRSTP